MAVVGVVRSRSLETGHEAGGEMRAVAVERVTVAGADVVTTVTSAMAFLDRAPERVELGMLDC
jgi:hypothetical protein